MFFRRKKEETPQEIINRTLTRYSERLVILEAIQFACNNHVAVIEVIFESEDANVAKEKLSREFGFSREQSQAVIDMRLRTFTKSERKKIFDECQECRSRYEELQKEKTKLSEGKNS